MNQPPAAKRRGTGWLVLGIVMVGVGVIAVVSSGRMRAAIGISAMPGDAGREPVGDAAHGDAAVAARGHEVVMPPSAVVLAPATSPARPAEIPTGSPAISAKRSGTDEKTDEKEAGQVLESAQRSLATLTWSEAGVLAGRAAALAGDPGTKERAMGVMALAHQAELAFARLKERDELSRNWDTHPSLVRIGDGTSGMLAIPLAEIQPSGPEPAVAPGDPVAFIETARKLGPVHALVKGRNEYIVTVLPDSIGDISRVDVAAAIAQRRAELTAKLADIGGGAQAGEALAWYAAARFAFRNRVDDLVSGPLAKAFALDRNLVESVRDDKSARLFAALVFHVTNGNRTQAAAFYGRIIPAYADTEHGKQAEAYWKRRSQTPDTPAAPTPAAGPKAADAGQGPDAEFAAGRDAYAKAQQLPLTDERNALYRAAIAHFDVALAGYKAMQAKTPTDAQLQDRVTDTQMLRFAAMKYLTDFE